MWANRTSIYCHGVTGQAPGRPLDRHAAGKDRIPIVVRKTPTVQSYSQKRIELTAQMTLPVLCLMVKNACVIGGSRALNGKAGRMIMPEISGLMRGKRGLIMGVANNRSIAWGIARAC